MKIVESRRCFVWLPVFILWWNNRKNRKDTPKKQWLKEGAGCMLWKPRCLGKESLEKEELAQDKKHCRKFGPCGVGEKAIYLNSFYFERIYYIPLTSVKRVFIIVLLSKGGFRGKGLFATIPYLVVEYDNGEEKQCNFKFEENVDSLLAYLKQ